MSTLQRIRVVPGSISGHAAYLVDARELHAFLGVRRDFSTWIKSRIQKYSFEDDQDFVVIDSPNRMNQAERGSHRRSIERVTDLTGSLINTLRLRAGVRKYTEDLSHPSLVNLGRTRMMTTTMLALSKQAKNLWGA